jgi:hypothetical protein
MKETMCRVGGAQRPVLYVIEPKTTWAPSARARSAAKVIITYWGYFQDDSPVSMAQVGPLRECQDIMGPASACIVIIWSLSSFRFRLLLLLIKKFLPSVK